MGAHAVAGDPLGALENEGESHHEFKLGPGWASEREQVAS